MSNEVFQINDFIAFLQTYNNEDLPGIAAHLEMTPYRNKEMFLETPSTAKQSAVAIVLYRKKNTASILLTQRAEYKGVHSGQISFPGGKSEKNDENLLATAIRETKEEIGIELSYSSFVTELSPLYIPPSNYMVSPFLFYVKEKIDEKLSHEVKQLIHFPITELLSSGFIKHTDIALSNEKIISNAPYIAYENKIIWGATAAMLNELKYVLNGFLKK